LLKFIKRRWRVNWL